MPTEKENKIKTPEQNKEEKEMEEKKLSEERYERIMKKLEDMQHVQEAMLGIAYYILVEKEETMLKQGVENKDKHEALKAMLLTCEMIMSKKMKGNKTEKEIRDEQLENYLLDKLKTPDLSVIIKEILGL